MHRPAQVPRTLGSDTLIKLILCSALSVWQHPMSSARESLNVWYAPESLDELDVFGLSARLVQDAKVSLALVQSFGAFAKTTSKTVVDL